MSYLTHYLFTVREIPLQYDILDAFTNNGREVNLFWGSGLHCFRIHPLIMNKGLRSRIIYLNDPDQFLTYTKRTIWLLIRPAIQHIGILFIPAALRIRIIIERIWTSPLRGKKTDPAPDPTLQKTGSRPSKQNIYIYIYIYI